MANSVLTQEKISDMQAIVNGKAVEISSIARGMNILNVKDKVAAILSVYNSLPLSDINIDLSGLHLAFNQAMNEASSLNGNNKEKLHSSIEIVPIESDLDVAINTALDIVHDNNINQFLTLRANNNLSNPSDLVNAAQNVDAVYGSARNNLNRQIKTLRSKVSEKDKRENKYENIVRNSLYGVRNASELTRFAYNNNLDLYTLLLALFEEEVANLDFARKIAETSKKNQNYTTLDYAKIYNDTYAEVKRESVGRSI